MCGILGTVPGYRNERKFLNALNELTHRGPDAYGVKHCSDFSFGHRRLSILDLSDAGKQPMSYAADRYEMVFNGEIYNYREIRDLLTHKGYQFKSTSDSEVVLASYAEWGPDCLKRFNGMWAIAIWDRKENHLFLSRDRFGKKPLFYVKAPESFVFASEMKALLPFLDTVKPSTMFDWMVKNPFLYESTAHCLVEGIARFPAGHYGYLKNHRLEMSRYWNTLDHLETPPESYPEQLERFRELLWDSCKLRMRSDVPIGTALSGGLDSSAIFSIITNIFKEQKLSRELPAPKAFVATFPGSAIDESSFAKQVTGHLQAKADFIEIDPLKEWSRISDHIRMVEEIYITSPIPMLMTYAAVRKGGVKVTLDGHGADELFSGYGHLRFAYRDAKSNFNRVSDIYSMLHPHQPLQMKNLFAEMLNSWGRDVAKSVLGKASLSEDYRHPNFRRLSHLDKSLYEIFHETILPTLLRNYDRYSMASGIEIRMPFMDHRLVTYAFSLPPNAKNGNGYTKKIIRDSVADLLPHTIAYRKDKIGFNSPMTEWMRGPLKEFFMDSVHSSEFSHDNLITGHNDLRQLVTHICSGEDRSYAAGESAWCRIYPFFWGKSFLMPR